VTVVGVPVEEVEVDEEERPVMWNGKLYWKIVPVESPSRESLNPYVGKLVRFVGTVQVYFPTELEIPVATTSPRESVLVVAPSKSVMVTVDEE
jgi:hypothetical protein